MKIVKYISLLIVFLLSCYLIATAIFIRLFRMRIDLGYLTRTPAPTFTPAPTEVGAGIIVATPIPVDTLPPFSTSTPTAIATLPSSTPTNMPTEPPPQIEPTLTAVARPELVAANNVNVRTGPGTNYPVIGTLPPNTLMPIVGRNPDASWWQINANGTAGWVADSVVEASHTTEVAIVNAPPPPEPTPTPLPPTPEKPKYQFEPTGWYNDTNYGLTRFLGNITDVDGNPVNGVYVQASCGSFSAISSPSGPIGGLNNEGADWPPGFYDIVLDTKPIPCKWILTIITTNDQRTATGKLSEDIEVEITYDKSIVTANWRKNW